MVREHSVRPELLALKNNQHTELRSYSQEVHKYFNEPLIAGKDDTLADCKEHGAALYQGIAIIALRYLPNPATEVPSKCTFSTAGNIVTSGQESLKPGHVKLLVS